MDGPCVEGVGREAARAVPAVRGHAQRALPLFFAEVGAPGKARPFFARVAGKRRVGELMLRLADIYHQHGKTAEEATIRADLARR